MIRDKLLEVVRCFVEWGQAERVVDAIVASGIPVKFDHNDCGSWYTLDRASGGGKAWRWWPDGMEGLLFVEESGTSQS